MHGHEDADDPELAPAVDGPRPQGIEKGAGDGVGRGDRAGERVGPAQFAHHEDDAECHHGDGESSDEGRGRESRGTGPAQDVDIWTG